MSGKPNPEGVKKAIELLDKISSLSAETDELRRCIDRDTDRYNRLKEELDVIWVTYRKLMKEMDVSAEGNTGFEMRAAWFLTEMKKQLKENK